jgi:hypothetical protein
MSALWHARTQDDGGQRWIRDAVARLAREI